MREYKFRAYDKLLKIMITKENVKEHIDNVSDWKEGYPYSSDEWYPAYEILALFEYFNDILEEKMKRYEPESEKRFEVMQFTGLHDKNGKEIYESDIVEVTRQCIWEKGVVVFIDGCFFIKVNETLLALYECEPNNYELKVIGNIYENSDLLKGADNIEQSR